MLVCFIDGFDFNRINPETTPFLAISLRKYPFARISTNPCTDHLPTLLTGKHPHEHEIFDVVLTDHKKKNNLLIKFFQLLPDLVTTSLQCFLYLISASFDLPTIPPDRRGLFQIMRTKTYKQKNNYINLLKIGDSETVFNLVGKEQCRYLFTNSTRLNQKILPKIGRGDYTLEFVEVYSVDIAQMWNMDKASKIDSHYRGIDLFMNNLHEKCLGNGTKLILVSDHGYDKVVGTIDILSYIRDLNICEDEFTYFIQFPMARFWFKNNISRNKASEFFHGINNMKTFTWRELKKFDLVLQDSRYGEIFCMAKRGYIFFPNDFVQPMADLFLGLFDKEQRPRLFDSKHKGSHTFLREYDSSRGFLIIFDEKYKPLNSNIKMVDVAPSLLKILGYKTPDSMTGKPAFNI